MAISLTARGAAALLSTLVLDRLGLKFAALLGIAAYLVLLVVYLRLARGQLPALWVVWLMVAIPSIGSALYDFAVNASRFRWVSKAQAGTDYSVQSSFWNLGVWLGGSLSGFLAGRYGYPLFYSVAFTVAATVALGYLLSFDRFEKLVLARERDEV
jgi:MFS family permease